MIGRRKMLGQLCAMAAAPLAAMLTWLPRGKPGPESVDITMADLSHGTITPMTPGEFEPFGCWSVTVDGTRFQCSYEPDVHGHAKHEAAKSLVWYVNEFVFYGCGGANHAFVGDPADVQVALKCYRCGALKKMGMSHDAEKLRRDLWNGSKGRA